MLDRVEVLWSLGRCYAREAEGEEQARVAFPEADFGRKGRCART